MNCNTPPAEILHGELPDHLSKDDFDLQVNTLRKTEPFKSMIDSESNRTLFEKATRDKGQDLYAKLGRAGFKTITQKKQKKENAEKLKEMQHGPEKDGPHLG